MPERIDARLDVLARRRAAVVAVLPTTEQAVLRLRDLVDDGLPGYREPADEPFAIPDTVDPGLRAAMVAWEEHQHERARLWAEDRFRLGFALGCGLAAELLLVDVP
jgi:hypothetical protein